MTVYGLTAQGWVTKPLSVIVAEVQADLQATFGAGINLSSSSVFGQLANRLAQRESDLWSLGASIYAAFDPLSAGDAAQDNICALTGVTRLPASFSTATEVLVGTNATVVPQGTVFSAAGNSKVSTDAAATIATVSAWVALETVALYTLRSNDTGKIYCAVSVSGVTAASGGPVGTGTAIVDGSVTWSYVATAAAAVVQTCTAQTMGALTLVAGSLTTIETPVGGLTSAVNPLDGGVGRSIESNTALRIRREATLRQQGNATLEALRSDILTLPVTAVNVLQNDTDLTDGNGLPPHSIECIVLGGTDAAVRAAIFASKAAGTRAFGSTTGTVTDSMGVVQEIDFTRPTTLNIWIIVNVIKDTTTFPTDGVTQIKAALTSYALGTLLDSAGKQIFVGYSAGDVVNAWNLVEAVSIVSGVKRITSILIGLSNPPTLSVDLATTIRQLAQFDTTRITVNVT